MTTKLSDARARERIRKDLDATLFVEAAAGTGKTTVLVERMVALLLSGKAELERMVAVTFTEKAAGEMKLRLRSEIEKARSKAKTKRAERARLDHALSQLELARIGTIHAFCADLLRERPVEAGVDPLFEVMPEDRSNELLDHAFDAWFQEVLADPPEGVRRMLRRRPRGYAALGPRDNLRNAVGNLREHRDFDAAWRRDPFDREAAIDALLSEFDGLVALAEEAPRQSDYLAKNLREIADFVDENALRERVRDRDYDGLEADLRELRMRAHWHWKGGGQYYAAGVLRADAVAQRNHAKELLDALIGASDADLAPLLRAELRPVIERYEAAKRRVGALDFLDLLLVTRNLVKNDASVRAELQRRFTHFFVDEFQDTDPLQAELLLLLAADDPNETDARAATPHPGKLFLVGDPKQSIYRFRRADVARYEATKEQLLAVGGEVVHLTTNFRSVPALHSLVNAAFEPQMQGSPDGSQAHYVALESAREEAPGTPPVIALPVPAPYAHYGKVTKWSIDDSLPDAVGAFVHWLVEESGFRVTEKDREVPVEARHVCLLFRRFKRFREDVTRPYVRALEVRQVPHVLVGGRSFHDREEVLAIRNALCAIEWPDDELRVFATLRGPFFALGDDALLAYRDRARSLHPLRPPDALGELSDEERSVQDALDVLRELHISRNRRPIAETVSRLLAAVRAHAGIAIWPTGEQALANCLRVVDLARRFESRGATSFRAFVVRMEAEAERGEAEDAPVVEEGSEGVRIMTVHKAKGLEFPVVILVDPTCNATQRRPSRFVDVEAGLWAESLCGCIPNELAEVEDDEMRRERDEAVRVAYVAATRARDLLVVPVVGDEECEGWIDVLHDVVHPEPEARRNPKAAKGCPDFGDDSVKERPPDAERAAAQNVAPGLHAPRAGSHEVVWWDPNVLELGVEQDVGIRQEKILVADEGGAVAQAGEAAHEAWRAKREDALRSGSAPSFRVAPATEVATRESEDVAESIETVRVKLDRKGRPSGKRFGTLVHATLAVVPLSADRKTVSNVARSQARLVGATDAERAAAEAAVVAALNHPLLRRAAAAQKTGDLRRETPLLFARENGELVEGVVDLAFREREGAEPRWTVVDFKTDREIAPRKQEYAAQVGLYVRGVREATGEDACGMLLVV